ncbi:aminotransferase class V-fold PLP-dependent enzyme [Cellulomonas soli]|uniref:Aminotransferase class V n=1 Tax=Cellulomonas soli TaxID=931535 RepID=A0A512PHV6_9CELL|nr:aminotransferase class V-fold PLP-dependent enzyme [Cellulomonas soli]NYI59272.1 selenocysteine lyase/cysteine desulfurase [Cellulomonas soli]GEP70776.1 aminotransferase class V [Cellulomonas soli]
MTTTAASLLTAADLRELFAPVPGHLDAATAGLPLRATTRALHDHVDAWQAGRLDLAVCDDDVVRSRSAFARIVGVDVSDVAIGSQASVLVGLVAAALPDGAEVVVAHGDFTSVVFPFLTHADRGVTVRHVPVEQLADAIGPRTSAVAFSLAQSRDGRLADAAAIGEAAARVGALTVCDLTQSAGWLPVDASAFDVTVTSTYKWLTAPRGVAFLTARPTALARLRPLHAGWYAGHDIWQSAYGPHMRLADDARRLDVSPAWPAWAGAAPALETFAAADIENVRRHDVGLADRLLTDLDLAPRGSAIVSLPDDEVGTARCALEAAGCRVAGRGGGVRLAFHVWNDEDDVDRAVAALRPHVRAVAH